MKIWLLSDLHTEVVGISLIPPDADICIAAGDIDRGGERHVQWLKEFVAPHMPVVSVLGNHEFYRSSVERERIAAGRAAAQGDVHVLDDMTWTENGVRFIGATLWTDYDLYNPDADPDVRIGYMRHARAGLNDHRLVRDSSDNSRPFLPSHARELHQRSVEYIESVLAEDFDGDTVVVTHHSPSPRSVHQVFQGDVLTPAFSSDLEWLIEKYQPAAWVHGHTHSSFDYEIGGTRVICNPRGYSGENADFDAGFVIEIGGYRPRMKL